MSEVNTPRFGFPWAAAVIFSAIFAYPLSLGPAVWIYERLSPSSPMREILPVIYFPLDWLAQYNSTFHDLLNWYAELWQP